MSQWDKAALEVVARVKFDSRANDALARKAADAAKRGRAAELDAEVIQRLDAFVEDLKRLAALCGELKKYGRGEERKQNVREQRRLKDRIEAFGDYVKAQQPAA
ncbi:MAG: hypothetical protein K2Y71_29245 [Xanthobacteraceae bacterium]|nr:hypothetical protein [Xanthobacteraceae bacterium]